MLLVNFPANTIFYSIIKILEMKTKRFFMLLLLVVMCFTAMSAQKPQEAVAEPSNKYVLPFYATDTYGTHSAGIGYYDVNKGWFLLGQVPLADGGVFVLDVSKAMHRKVILKGNWEYGDGLAINGFGALIDGHVSPVVQFAPQVTLYGPLRADARFTTYWAVRPISLAFWLDSPDRDADVGASILGVGYWRVAKNSPDMLSVSVFVDRATILDGGSPAIFSLAYYHMLK